MDDDARRPRRLLSFDASQVSLSRLGKALYYSRPQQTTEEIEGAQDGSVTFTARAPLIAMAAGPDHKHAALLSKESLDVLRLSATNQTVVTSMKIRPRYNPSTVEWAPGGQIALGDSGGTIALFSVNSAGDLVASAGQSANLHSAVTSVCFSSPHLLLAATSDGAVKLYDMRQSLRKGAVSSFLRDGDIAREVQFRPDSETKFGVIYDSGMVQRWDVRSPAAADLRINAHYQGLSLHWHSHANALVTGGRDKRIHVWNLTTESRTPEYTIQTASAVAKVRWMPGEQHVKTTPIVSCGRSPTDFAVSYWELRRPWSPTFWCEGHTSAVTGLAAISPKVLWSVSKDKTFRQTDVQNEPRVADNWPPALCAWAADDHVALTFALTAPRTAPVGPLTGPPPSGPVGPINMHRHQSVSVSRPPLAGSSLAPLSSLPTDLHRSKSWDKMPGPLVSPREETELGPTTVVTLPYPAEMENVFKMYAENYIYNQEPGETLGALCRHNAHISHQCRRFRTSQMWRIVAAAVDYTENAFVRSLPPMQQDAARAMFSLQLEPERQDSVAVLVEDVSSESHPVPAAGRPLAPAPAPERFDWRGSGVTFTSELSGTSDSAGSVDAPPSRLTAAVKALEANPPVAVPQSAMSVVDVQPSSVRSSYFGQFESVSAMGTSAASGMSVASSTGLRNPRLSSGSRPGWERTFSESPLATLQQQFLDFVADQTEPWELVPALRRTLQHTFVDGLSCTSAAMYLLFRHIPDLLPQEQMEESLFACIEQMRAICSFVPAAHIMSVTSVWQDNAGAADTTADLVCHRCLRSLGENAALGSQAAPGFWYCMHCRQLLDGCSICNQPVKGLCTVLLRCGHKAHPACWAQWAVDMDECPAGCGEQV